MTPYPNLISESLLINETVTLLRSFGGKASAVSVVDFVMKIQKARAVARPAFGRKILSKAIRVLR